MHFQQLYEPGDDAPLAAGYVDIEVKAVSLNAKDVYAMNGHVEARSKTTAFDFSGVVTATGGFGSDLKMGDRVITYATALYALTDRAHLRRRESILVHAGSGDFGVTAIALAQMMGAVACTTCGSQAERDYLVSDLGVTRGNIYSSGDASFM
jgi:NADPH:quinone reductase-like Zn-dependent oxidoreductase